MVAAVAKIIARAFKAVEPEPEPVAATVGALDALLATMPVWLLVLWIAFWAAVILLALSILLQSPNKSSRSQS